MPKKIPLEEWESHFFSKLKAESVLGCWEWTRGLTSDGYGAINHRNKSTKAHRALFVHLYGELPENIGVLHKCDNRKCCNPFHLFTGTQKQNIDDAVKKGRQPRARGERQWGHILTAQDVIKMRSIRRNTGRTYRDIGKEFGVHEMTAQQAIVGYTWAHIEGAISAPKRL